MQDPLRMTKSGELFRRYHVYITHTDGRASRIECVDPQRTSTALTQASCNLIAYMDAFHDGQALFTCIYDRDDALADFLNEYPSLTPATQFDDGQFVFAAKREQIAFQMKCL